MSWRPPAGSLPHLFLVEVVEVTSLRLESVESALVLVTRVALGLRTRQLRLLLQELTPDTEGSILVQNLVLLFNVSPIKLKKLNKSTQNFTFPEISWKNAARGPPKLWRPKGGIFQDGEGMGGILT